MRFLILFTLTIFTSFANVIRDNIFKNFFEHKELETFKTEAFKSQSQDFNLPTSILKLDGEEFKIALSFIFINQSNLNFASLTMKELKNLYLFSSSLPKRDFVFSQIKNYIKAFKVSNDDFESKMSEIEEMIWFFVMTEHNGLLQFLSKNKLTVQDFITFVSAKKDFNYFRDIIIPKEEEPSLLLWDGKVTNALPLILNLPDGEAKDTLLSRIFFQTKNPKYYEVAKKMIARESFSDDGFMYDYIKYLAKTEHYKDALLLLNRVEINPSNPRFNKFWRLMEELFRYHMEQKDYYSAFELLNKINLSEDINFAIFARAKFLAGFVALRFLKDPEKAIPFFEAIYLSKSASVYTKSRGAFYIYLSYKSLGNKGMEKTWLINASKFLNTFYGMLALDTLNEIEPVTFFGTNKYTEAKIKEALKKRNEVHKFYFDEFLTKYYANSQINLNDVLASLRQNVSFKIGLLMLLMDRPADANGFFAISTSQMSLPEVKLAFDILNFYINQNNIKNGKMILETFSSKASNQGAILVESYPLLDFIVNEKNINPNPLVHAIIKQESNFKIQAISGPGAIGLMQVMPSTGRIVSKNASLVFDLNRLKNDYKYNIQIGAYYLDVLLGKFGGSYPYALVGYNAGPNRVNSWKKRYFEAEPEDIDDMLNFIEMIPFTETREYVFRVMENEVIYNYLIEHHFLGSLLPLEKKDKDFNELLKQYLLQSKFKSQTSNKKVTKKERRLSKQDKKNKIFT
jgi:soluble lytic murein transglycosylase-like protein